MQLLVRKIHEISGFHSVILVSKCFITDKVELNCWRYIIITLRITYRFHSLWGKDDLISIITKSLQIKWLKASRVISKYIGMFSRLYIYGVPSGRILNEPLKNYFHISKFYKCFTMHVFVHLQSVGIYTVHHLWNSYNSKSLISNILYMPFIMLSQATLPN